MVTAFQRAWITPTEYRIYEVEFSRYVSETGYQPYLDWIVAGNVPENVSGDRFVLIAPDGTPYWDPNKAAILAAEAYAAAHPPVVIDDTVIALCRVIDSILKGDTKGAPYFDYIRMRWYSRDITAADIAKYVQRRYLEQTEANAIMAVEQVPV